MSNIQSKQQIPASTYISIIILMFIALSGTVYLVYYAINKPPFDVEFAVEVATKDGVQCVISKLVEQNIPHENVEHLERNWVVLRNIKDKDKTKAILLNKCSKAK